MKTQTYIPQYDVLQKIHTHKNICNLITTDDRRLLARLSAIYRVFQKTDTQFYF